MSQHERHGSIPRARGPRYLRPRRLLALPPATVVRVRIVVPIVPVEDTPPVQPQRDAGRDVYCERGEDKEGFGEGPGLVVGAG